MKGLRYTITPLGWTFADVCSRSVGLSLRCQVRMDIKQKVIRQLYPIAMITYNQLYEDNGLESS